MSERLWYLKRCELFERLTSEQLAALESHCSMRKFPKRSLVYSPRDPTEGVFLMAAGRVKICTLTEDGKQARLILALLDLAEQYGYSAAGGIQLGVKLSHQDLANMIGSTRESVTIALGELQGEKHLRVGRRTIVLVDLERLARSVSAPVPVPGGRYATAAQNC